MRVHIVLRGGRDGLGESPGMINQISALLELVRSQVILPFCESDCRTCKGNCRNAVETESGKKNLQGPPYLVEHGDAPVSLLSLLIERLLAHGAVPTLEGAVIATVTRCGVIIVG